MSLVETLVVTAIAILLVGAVAVPLAVHGRSKAVAQETTMAIKTLNSAQTELYVLRRQHVPHFSGQGVEWDHHVDAFNADTREPEAQSYDSEWEWPDLEPGTPQQPASAGGEVPGHHSMQDVFPGPNDSIERFVWMAMQVPSARSVLDGLDEHYLNDGDGDGFLEIRDGWGQKLRYASYHSYTWEDGKPLFYDQDMEIRDWAEGWPKDIFWVDSLPERGSANHQRPFFLSSGPDVTFGRYGYDGYERLQGMQMPMDNAEATDEDIAHTQDNLLSYELTGG
jgi:type II secretory pathway pseudopilin PulG